MQRTIHLYIAKRLEPLKKLLERHENNSRFDPINIQPQMGLNVWLIPTSDRKRNKTLEKLLKTCHLRFDSHVFEFNDGYNGK
jgi:hypothetical protein